MKYIVVTSDSHGNTNALKYIALRYPDAFCYLNLGDFCDSEEAISPFLAIKGNNDYLPIPLQRIITIDNTRILMLHGHNIFLSLSNLLAIAKRNNCNIILYGHTHILNYKIIDNVHIINPGAITYPRSEYGQTYALIYFNDNTIEVKFKSLDTSQNIEL